MRLILMVLCLIILSLSAAFAADTPAGVAPELVPMYAEKEHFECLDGSKKISYDQVNDEYCDCADGSDEPGTSACSNGHFYCHNTDYQPLVIPSSHVNDFICDCCDGSDEWNSGVNCPNICREQGKQAREEARRQREIQQAGYAKRVELAKVGARIIDERRAESEKARKELDELQPLKTDLEQRKNTAEEREQEAKEKHENAYNVLKEELQAKKSDELFAQITNNGDVLHLQQFVDYIKSKGEATLETIKEIFGENDRLDVGAFRAIGTKVCALLKKLTAEKLDSNATIQSTDSIKIPTEETTSLSPASSQLVEDEEAESNVEDSDDVKQHSSENVDSGESTNEPETDGEEQEEDQLPRPPYDEVTQAVIAEANAARRQHEEILRKVADLENSIRNSERVLSFEYGPDHAWASLKGQCAELSTTQYTYRLCPFDRAIQKDRNGYSEVNLGYWGEWIGPESNKYTAQLYNKGQGCWNGPERSTRVDILCGAEIELVEANEPSKCEYHFVLKSPTACENPATMAQDHMEL